MALQTLKPRLAVLDTRRVPTMQAGSWRTSDQTSSQRGYGYKWQKARAGFLRSHPYCERCLELAGVATRDVAAVILECVERGVAPPYANVVDHKVPHRGDQGLFWDKGNWQSLCATHHSRDKQREETRL